MPDVAMWDFLGFGFVEWQPTSSGLEANCQGFLQHDYALKRDFMADTLCGETSQVCLELSGQIIATSHEFSPQMVA